MNRKHAFVALALMACGSIVSAQTAPVPAPPPTDAEKGESGYVGASTRVGLGYDDKTKLRGELYRVFSESDTTALLGEAWISRNAGGLKFSFNWLPEPATGPVDPTVRKFFVAADRNTEGDAKVTLGGGFEKAGFFGGLYGSAGITGRREIGDSTVSTVQTIQGDDGRPFLQDITTSVRTRIFERPYDYGVGARVGHFHEQALVRLTLGADYEWGRDSARQTTVSLGLEKFFYNAPYSLALNVEHYRKSGGFDSGSSDNRFMAMLRYEFGGPSFRPVKEYRMVEAPAKSLAAATPAPQPPEPAKPPVVAAAPVTAPAAPPAPRTEKRLVKTTASMSADAFFEFDKSTLTPAARSALDGVIGRIKTSGFEGNLHLTGHTCNIGSAAYNLGLSQRRASAVKNYLVANGGIQSGVILAEGRGLTNPKYPNTRAERYKNRRVDLEFVTYEDKVEEITLSPEPVPAAVPPAPAPVAVPATVAPPAPVAAVEWRREVIEKEPTWVRRALRQSLPHKQAVDVYRQREQATTTTQGEKRYINRPPVAANDAFTVPFNSSGNVFDVLANDSDPDGDPLTITGVGTPAHGTAVVAAGKVSYTAASGYSGTDTFTYAIADGKGGTASAIVTVTVQGPPNHAPVAQNDTYVLDQNSTNNSLNVLANDSDPDGDTLVITSVGTPGHGSASIAGNKVVYTPASGFTGSDSFSYAIADGKGGTASATVSITIQAVVVNHPPVAQNDAYTVDQNSSANSLNVLANDSDPDGDTLTITTVSTPAHGTASIAGNKVSYTPAPGYSGADTFTYSIADGKGGTASASVAITVTVPVPNHPPVAQNDAYTVDQNSSANSLDVLANDSDPDGDPLTITAVGTPAHGTASIINNRISYTPAAGYTGSDSFTYTIADGRGGSASATVAITVVVPNHPPVAQNDAFTVNQNSSGNSLNVLANDSDPDGDALTITGVGAPAHGTASIVGNRVSYTPAPGYGGSDSFSYSIADGRGGTASASVSITVTSNHPPVALDDTFVITKHITDLDVLANDSDPDGDSLTIVAVTQPLSGFVAINADGKSLRYTTAFSFNHTTFTYTISDGHGGTATATVTLIDP
jgi:outer membrane protein OmpA-like peptidoglycan-associated protein